MADDEGPEEGLPATGEEHPMDAYWEPDSGLSTLLKGRKHDKLLWLERFERIKISLTASMPGSDKNVIVRLTEADRDWLFNNLEWLQNHPDTAHIDIVNLFGIPAPQESKQIKSGWYRMQVYKRHASVMQTLAQPTATPRRQVEKLFDALEKSGGRLSRLLNFSPCITGLDTIQKMITHRGF